MMARNVPWSVRECVRLAKLCDEGLSYTEAGEAMGRSRNSTGGKAQSLGLKFHGRGFTRGSKHKEETKAKIGHGVHRAWDVNWRKK
jgi:hypothetical protein